MIYPKGTKFKSPSGVYEIAEVLTEEKLSKFNKLSGTGYRLKGSSVIIPFDEMDLNVGNRVWKIISEFAEGGTTNYGVDELYDIARRTFIGLGYDVTQGSNSKTDYGHSRYFYVNQDNKADVNSGLGFQVRVSDHSTGDRRILNGEQFIFDNKDVMEVFNRINYWFHPEEYKNVVVVKTKVVQIEVGENDLQPSDEIISERVAKSGNKRYTIKRTYKNEGVVPTHKFSGHKLPFKPNNPDFRFAEGGKTKRYMKKIKRGGITYGKSHAEGGIPVKNQSTGDMLEVEGGEGIVNKRSMASDKKVKLNGKEMTICEAVSQLNQLEGGVQFSCDDVSDRQFIEAMAKGGELERGVRTEQEHIQVLKDLYAKRITPKQASKRIAKDHLKEDAHYYSKLSKMEGKMAKGGEIFDKETEDLLSDLTKKYAKGGKVVADKTETINMKDFEGYADQYNGRKNKFFKANDEYQLLVNEGMELKNNTTLPQDEKDKLLAELREKAREAKTTLGEKRKDFVDMREVKSPFYAPQLADGGRMGKTPKERIDKGEGGTYKIKAKHPFFPSKGVDVYLHIDSQSMRGTIQFTLGTRNLDVKNPQQVIFDFLEKKTKLSPSSYQVYVTKEAKSVKVKILFNFPITSDNFSYISMEVLKALTNKEYYQSILDDKKEEATPPPPTEKEDDWNWRFKTEAELIDLLGTDFRGKNLENNQFVEAMDYLLGKKIKETAYAKIAIEEINKSEFGKYTDTELNFNLPNPKGDSSWSISSWMITNKPLAGEAVPPTEEKKYISVKEVEEEIMRWTAEKVEEKNGLNSLKYQTPHLLRYILLNQARGKMSDFTQLIAMAKQSRKLEIEILKLAEQGIPIDSFVTKLLLNRFLESVEDVKSQIMIFVKYESDIDQELGRIVLHIPYLAELDTFDKNYIIHIK